LKQTFFVRVCHENGFLTAIEIEENLKPLFVHFVLENPGRAYSVIPRELIAKRFAYLIPCVFNIG
jgi:hypothetical protein